MMCLHAAEPNNVLACLMPACAFPVFITHTCTYCILEHIVDKHRCLAGDTLQEVTVQDESRDMWRIYLDQQDYRNAFRHCKSQVNLFMPGYSTCHLCLYMSQAQSSCQHAGAAGLLARSLSPSCSLLP